VKVFLIAKKGGKGERGFEHDEPLTVGRAVAGLNACSEGVR
jgi:hypothetical protein